MIGRPRTASNDDIFRAVTAAISKVGPARLTLAAVAAEVGISTPSIVQRFGTKQGMIEAYALSEVSYVAEAFEAAKGASNYARLLDAVRRLVEGSPSRTAIAYNLSFVHHSLAEPDLRRYVRQQHRELDRNVTSLLAAAVDAGELTCADVGELAGSVRDAYFGSLTSWASIGRGTVQNWTVRRIEAVLRPYVATGCEPYGRISCETDAEQRQAGGACIHGSDR